MTIPIPVLMKLATMGLSSEIAAEIAEMLSAVETATEEQIVSSLQSQRESSRIRTARYHERLGLTSREWNDLRNYVLDRDGDTCAYCGKPANPPHVDHIIPLVKGGSNDPENLTVACRECNSGKSGRTPEEWLRGQTSEGSR